MKGNRSANQASREARDPHTFQNEDLCNRIWELDNESAWTIFFKASRAAVFQIAQRKGLSATEADDLLDDVMLVLVREITKSESRHENILAWVRSVASHKAADLQRRRQISEKLDMHSADWNEQEPEASDITAWRIEALPIVLEKVQEQTSKEDFSIFNLVMIRGCRAREISRVMRKSVKSIYRARTRVIAAVLVEFQNVAETFF